MRLNARISDEQAKQLEELRQATGGSTSDIVREALRRYYEEMCRRHVSANQVLEQVGFIGCGEADPELSTRYKEALTGSLEQKHGHR